MNSYKAPSTSQTMSSISNQSAAFENEFGILDFSFIKFNPGESIRVCLRIRPMAPMEVSRSDGPCLSVADTQNCVLNFK